MKKANKISAFGARTHLGEILDEVRYNRKPYIIERHGKPVAVVLDFKSYQDQQTHFEKFENLKQQYDTWVERATRAIVEKYEPEKIILFGSVATGTMHEGSDIDLFIIKETEKRKLDRYDDVMLAIDRGIPIEPHIYTPAEVEQRLALGDAVIKQIVDEGKVLYAANES